MAFQRSARSREVYSLHALSLPCAIRTPGYPGLHAPTSPSSFAQSQIAFFLAGFLMWWNHIQTLVPMAPPAAGTLPGDRDAGVPEPAAAAAAAGSGTPASLSPGSVPAAGGAMGTRVWIWFHHIKNPAKKKAICDWAKELGLVGACKPGYPGVLIAQGSESACKEYTSRLRALRWKAMAVRAEEPLNRGVAEAEAEFAAALAGCGSAFAGHVRGVALLGEQDLGLAASLFDRLGCGGTFRRVILKMSSERDPEPGDELGGADSS
mmetsp:Transcript_14692/g.55367  ORF Transcript_14692/g.55367 Transcript_14692/m.55367 type:complete len:264 (+) Transcript_14692:354-1145(+)